MRNAQTRASASRYCRDVQGILALTAQDFDPEDPSWVTNAAGYNHSYKYGFGVVKATDALTRASTWKHFGNETQLKEESGLVNLTIPDDATKIVTSSVSFPEWEKEGFFLTESVVVYADIQHPSRGDLTLVLTSPGGTASILHPSKRPERLQLEGEDRGKWKLLSLRTWGEFPAGEWTLSLVDDSPGNYGDCFDIPWEYSYASSNSAGNETLTCADFETVTDCSDETQVNPAALKVIWENRTLLQSCCNCGGGKASSGVAPILRAWRMIIYGRIVESKKDFLVSPPSPSRPSPSSEGDSGGESPGSSIEIVVPDGSLNFGSGDADGPNDYGWDNRGSGGSFAGGGGTAYMSPGWRGGDGEDDPLLNRSNAANNGLLLTAFVGFLDLAIRLW